MIAFIACGASKLSHPAKARDLYTGALFQKSCEYAELRFYFVGRDGRNSRALVVSALHGLVSMDRELAPYDVSLDSLTREQLHHWRQHLRVEVADHTTRCEHALILAGGAYEDAIIDGLDLAKTRLERPLAGMMIGERLSFLTRENARMRSQLPRLSDHRETRRS